MDVGAHVEGAFDLAVQLVGSGDLIFASRAQRDPLGPDADADGRIVGKAGVGDGQDQTVVEDDIGKAGVVGVLEGAIEPVAAAHEARDKVGGGAGVDLSRGALLYDLSLVHHDDAVGEAHGFVLVVGDDDGGGAYGGEDLLQLDAEFLAQFGVEGGEGLV